MTTQKYRTLGPDEKPDYRLGDEVSADCHPECLQYRLTMLHGEKTVVEAQLPLAVSGSKSTYRRPISEPDGEKGKK